MKTTVDIADALLAAAKAVAARDGKTMRSLIEEGLRTVLAKRKRGGPAFRLRDASFRGKGLQPGVDAGDWERVASAVYEGRGG